MAKENVVGKIIVEGLLELSSPLLIGDGLGETNKENEKDIHVLKNEEGLPFIPGTSITGVLREYINKEYPKYEVALFGDMKTIQSSIIFDDIVLENAKITYRDGVSIDHYTGSGIKGAKYDYEVVDTSAVGKIKMEITLRGYHLENPKDIKSKIREDIINSILLIRDKLKDGIMLGAMTTKGFGRAWLKDSTTNFYDFSNKADVIAWLKMKKSSNNELDRNSNLSLRLNNTFSVRAEFAIKGSLIVRDYEANGEKTKDGSPISAIMMKSNGQYIIPGTSVKGVLRHQAEEIFINLKKDLTRLDDLMGNSKKCGEYEKQKSRLYVDEVKIVDKAIMAVSHTRNKIDRFTGGTMDTALFTTKPLWQMQSGQKALEINFIIQDATESEAGLALFLLKDIWQGKVAFGGEKGIGRGTLKGISAKIEYKGNNWQLNEYGKVTKGNKEELNKFAKAFVEGGAVI